MAGSIISVCGFTPSIGKDCFIAEGARVIGDVSIGDNSSVWFNAVLRGDVNSIKIGRGCNIQDGCVLHTQYKVSQIEIGDYVSVGHNVILHGTIIHDYALIGMGSVLLDDVEVGEGAIVAAGSVVLKGTKIEPYTLYGGYPAKFIKKVDPEQSHKMNHTTANHYAVYATWYMYPDQHLDREIHEEE
ncbi:gamma carbonic anhydrase family protein [Porphyromonas circumdentaria]|uniref:gamma carbonic anhydrase family protein n=1 Tax=Porphyromonas circumdentaria TaxID=29524 RepID=UPI0026DD696F|nr:gamma carbonic anhydrase family protein [Porphyromonas circumdentaria]MDO4722003.1 gamma carbonic anhydrase family protein [Porphyromonas circumdentaria]